MQPSTTKSNVALRYGKLEHKELPQTLQDAILMTRMLGLDYLWIDSICIVQDDKEEWASQASNMADIYSKAHVVLAATAARSATEGFLYARPRVQKILSLANPENPITVNARLVDADNHDHAYDSAFVRLDNQPLSKRGWALQERALAHRTVHFLRDEIVVECRSGLTCECGHLYYGQPYPSFVWPPDFHKLASSSFFPKHEASIYDRPIAFIWLKLVESFTARSLTYADDALPALSGIARRTLALEPGRYFAGIWERDISYQLGWTDISLDPHDEKKKVRPRPTFSWASSPRRVLWPIGLNTIGFEPICVFVAGTSVPCTGDIYGQVKEVCIQMQGLTIQGRDLVDKFQLCDLRHSWIGPAIHLDMMERFPRDKWSKNPKETWYEDLSTACDWDLVVCFALCKNFKDNVVSMLLLQAVPEEDAFERIGVVSQFPCRFFDESSTERTVTIV
jgi:hypothetical protein